MMMTIMVMISNQDKIDSIGFKKMPDSMFDSKHVDFSLGKTVEDEILGPKTWGAPKADHIACLPQMLRNLVVYQDNLEVLKTSYRNLLVDKGSVVISETNICHYVQSVSDQAVMVWRFI